MKLRFPALAAAVMIAFTSLAACSDKSKSDSENNVITEYLITRGTDFQDKFKNVPSAESGPLISISNTTAAPGETAEVTVSISNAELQWNMCGIHLTYPDVLECVIKIQDEMMPEYKKGAALEASSGFVPIVWSKNFPEELSSRHLGSLFFTAMFSDNKGLDGDIATFYFVVPQDAQPGAVYNIGYYYINTDMFGNLEGDPSFEKYAFEHMTGGTITVV